MVVSIRIFHFYTYQAKGSDNLHGLVQILVAWNGDEI